MASAVVCGAIFAVGRAPPMKSRRCGGGDDNGGGCGGCGCDRRRRLSDRIACDSVFRVLAETPRDVDDARVRPLATGVRANFCLFFPPPAAAFCAPAALISADDKRKCEVFGRVGHEAQL